MGQVIPSSMVTAGYAICSPRSKLASNIKAGDHRSVSSQVYINYKAQKGLVNRLFVKLSFAGRLVLQEGLQQGWQHPALLEEMELILGIQSDPDLDFSTCPIRAGELNPQDFARG